jgi:hypothetical protein
MTLTRLIPATLLAAALAAAPTLAADPTPEELKKSIDRFEKAVKDLQELKDALKTDNVREKVTTLDSKIDLIDKDIQDIKKDIRDLKRKADGSTSTSLRPDDSQTLRGQGRVRFINQYPEEMSVVINGRSYRLVPGEERLLTVPPGEFTYQVLQLQRDSQVRRIVADETKTIRIYPLQ